MKLEIKLTNSWIKGEKGAVLMDEVIDTKDGLNEIIYGSLKLTIKETHEAIE